MDDNITDNCDCLLLSVEDEEAVDPDIVEFASGFIEDMVANLHAINQMKPGDILTRNFSIVWLGEDNINSDKFYRVVLSHYVTVAPLYSLNVLVDPNGYQERNFWQFCAVTSNFEQITTVFANILSFLAVDQLVKAR